MSLSRLEDRDIKKLNVPFDCEVVCSFNAENCVTADTKIIIVGTITPPDGSKNGYFYTSGRNRIYGYIDEAFKTNLNDLKKKLSAPAPDKERIIDDIKKTLKDNFIAFLDVMKTAVRKRGSSADKDIEYYSLDFDAFEKLPESALIICNSRLAERSFEEICAKLNKNYEFRYLSQRWTTKNEWINILKTNI